MAISGDLLLMTNDSPSDVIKMLKKRIGDATKEQDRKNERRKRH